MQTAHDQHPQAPCALMVFVDGLGLGPADPAFNPLVHGAPVLAGVLCTEAVPVDAGLDTPGLPQSATGQTALLTGCNAAALLGRHREGFPGPVLKPLIAERNLLSALAARGRRVTFANAYYMDDVSRTVLERRPSVTTVAALAACGRVRDRDALLAGEAVYHDLTRAALRSRGYDGPLIEPEDAAAHLLGIARMHDFTLFEYFMTDRAGHRDDPAFTAGVLGPLDRFFAALLPFAEEPGRLLMLISDHGNVEDNRTRLHTLHPVPLIARGSGADTLRATVRRLEDFAPAVLALYGIGTA